MTTYAITLSVTAQGGMDLDIPNQQESEPEDPSKNQPQRV